MIGSFIFFILAAIAVIQYIRNSSEAVGNWSHLFSDMQVDPEEFYVKVKRILQERQVPNVGINNRNFKEGGMLSHQRVYLQVRRGDYIFHICAAPWGTGFFISWWLREKLSQLDELLIFIPYFGPRIVKLRQYHAYYKLDSDTMFRTSVHQSVLTAIDELTESKGIRGLTELERKPDLRSVLKQ